MQTTENYLGTVFHPALDEYNREHRFQVTYVGRGEVSIESESFGSSRTFSTTPEDAIGLWMAENGCAVSDLRESP